MRQGQQNRRGRGRNNNNNQNRKGQNPLTRSFESTGPDVKIRGTPSHIAEKYIALARDALSAGDPVLAENYLQHAEHYNRIIMAYREQQIAQGQDVPPISIARHRSGFGDPMGEEFGDEDGEEAPAAAGLEGQPSHGQPQPQMYQPRHHDNGPSRHEGGHRNDDRGDRRHREGGHRHHRDRDRYQDRYADRGDRGDRFDRDRDRGDRGERQDRFQQSDRGDRSERGDRGYERSDRGDRFDRNGDRPDRNVERGERNGERVERFERPEARPQAEIVDAASTPQPQTMRPPREPREPRGERAIGGAVPHHEQPEFLRRPVRRPRREAAAASAEEGAPAPQPSAVAEGE